MDLGLASAVTIVTGAASGIGRACARALVAEGSRVGLIDRDRAAGDGLARELGPAAVFVAADVTDEDALRDAVDAVAERFGRVDAVVCCAGISGPFGQRVEEISVADFGTVLAVNVTGAFLTVKHAVRHLRSSAAPAVVLLASDSSFVAAPGMVPYNASKGALLQLTRALSVDLAENGFRVNCVCPSVVDTPMARADLGIGPEGWGDAGFPVQSPDDVARHVVYLVSPASRPVNGHALVSDFGYLARSSFPA
ncbi:SDR family NAD(P)-dependent oxidoreductase [Leifsonia sp. NPDC058194]|uniref:SDR family NAD(P)-dependent oxidoreductase n=1 Tax=Leifsonia sp. NPDC058194 TaxID=3346374 RepID=UPI0036D9D529